MMRESVQRMLVAGALMAAMSFGPLLEKSTASDKPTAPKKVKIGDLAPEFKLQYFDGSDLKDVSLSQYRGKKNVVLAFYIFAFTGG